MSQVTAPNDKLLFKTEVLISKLLRYGVIVSAVIMAVGLMMMLFGGQSDESAQLILDLTSGKVLPNSAPALTQFEQLKDFSGQHIAALGILVLIALPIMRVGLTIFVFIFERDWIFVGITLFVFSVLIGGLFLGTVH